MLVRELDLIKASSPSLCVWERECLVKSEKYLNERVWAQRRRWWAICDLHFGSVNLCFSKTFSGFCIFCLVLGKVCGTRFYFSDGWVILHRTRKRVLKFCYFKAFDGFSSADDECESSQWHILKNRFFFFFFFLRGAWSITFQFVLCNFWYITFWAFLLLTEI